MSGKKLRKVPRLSAEVKRIVAVDVQRNWSRVVSIALCVERAIAGSGQT